MLITYRRTGGVFALLTLVAVALAATVVTVVVATTILIAAVGVAAVAVLARAVLPASWRRHRVPPAAPWPGETIEGDILRLDSDKG